MSRDRRTTIHAFVERAYPALDQVDYYKILGISSAASDEEVQAAYYRLASNLHPDMHGLSIEQLYRKKLTAVFSRVAEAYKILADPMLRARYDRELARGNLRMSMGKDTSAREPEVTNPAARKFYMLGKAAMDDGNRKSAVLNFRFALQQEPDNQAIKDALARAESGK